VPWVRSLAHSPLAWMKTSVVRLLFAAIDCLTCSSPEHLRLSIFFRTRDRPCFNPAMSGILEGFFLRIVTSVAATMGLILATIASLPHSASAANRGGLWVVVHDICGQPTKALAWGFLVPRSASPMVLSEALPSSGRLRALRMLSLSRPLGFLASKARRC